jgi:molybdopterin-guanine dinucleotide biosynthesis protein A
MNKEKITGVILAGGKNSRMGADKGMLEVGSKKIVERIIEAMKPVVGEIIIISNGENYDYLGYSVHKDIIKECGPMGGIHCALFHSKTDKILVIGCDMPFISEKILAALVKGADHSEITIPEHNGGEVEPLCAVYSKSAFSKFGELLKNGNWKMKDALRYFKVNRIKFSVEQLPDNHFLNVNTPSEYQSIKQTEDEYSN